MNLELISPEKTLYKGEVALIQLPGAMGPFQVLKNHAPMVALLEKGRVKIIDIERNLFHFDIEGGSARVNNNHITVVCF